MGKIIKKTATDWMWAAVERDDECPMCGRAKSTDLGGSPHPFPRKFIAAMRVALESGMSAEQVVAVIILAAGLFEADMDQGELMKRAKYMADTMKEDIVRVAAEQSSVERYRLKTDKNKRKNAAARKRRDRLKKRESNEGDQ